MLFNLEEEIERLHREHPDEWLEGRDNFDCMRRVRSTLRQIPYLNNNLAL
jgi:hypothetical protein